jgi:hypothetical protein
VVPTSDSRTWQSLYAAPQVCLVLWASAAGRSARAAELLGARSACIVPSLAASAVALAGSRRAPRVATEAVDEAEEAAWPRVRGLLAELNSLGPGEWPRSDDRFVRPEAARPH